LYRLCGGSRGSHLQQMAAAHSSSSIALTIFAGHFVFSSAVSSTSSLVSFVPVTYTHSPRLNIGQIGKLSTGMPRNRRLPLELRRQSVNSQICSFSTAATTARSREDPKSDFDNHSNWQDPVAALLVSSIFILLIVTSLCDQMQVCVLHI
jgi:hypothetical protein